MISGDALVPGIGVVRAEEAMAVLDGEVFAYTENGNFVPDVMTRTKR